MKRLVFFALFFSVLTAALFTTACSKQGEEASGSADGTAVPGVTDDEIILGTHIPLSGSPAAAYGTVADGMRAYFDYTNSLGGVYGRKIKLIVEDDHFSPPDAVEVVRKLVEQEHVLAIVGGLGDPAELAVIDYLEEEGVPDLFLGGGVPRFTDPVVKTRIAMSPDYVTETKVTGAYVQNAFAGQREGILYENDEAGLTGLQATKDMLKDSTSGIKIVSTQAYDLSQTDMTAQMQRLKADKPDFVVLMANIGAAANAIKVSRELLDWNVPFVLAADAAVEATIDLAGAKNIEGTVSMTTGKMISETDDPGVQRHIELMKEFAPNTPTSGLTEYGMSVAELTVQALKNAGPNLTRESLVDGAEHIRDYCCIVCLGPANLSPTDHRVAEGGWLERVVDGKWERFGPPVNYESTPGNVYACTGAGQPVYKSAAPSTTP